MGNRKIFKFFLLFARSVDCKCAPVRTIHHSGAPPSQAESADVQRQAPDSARPLKFCKYRRGKSPCPKAELGESGSHPETAYDALGRSGLGRGFRLLFFPLDLIGTTTGGGSGASSGRFLNDAVKSKATR